MKVTCKKQIVHEDSMRIKYFFIFFLNYLFFYFFIQSYKNNRDIFFSWLQIDLQIMINSYKKNQASYKKALFIKIKEK